MNRFRATLSRVTLGLVLSPAAAAAQQNGPAEARAPGVRADSIVPETRDRAASASVTELVRGRAAGLNVMESSGMAGASPRLWIRGPQSLALRNDPLVVVDGVRTVSQPDGLGLDLGGQSLSRLEDLSPEDVASVRVLRGPAAAALYGPEGAAGVLEIRTRTRARRRAGEPRVHAWSSLGLRQQATEFPDNYGRAGLVGTMPIGACSVQLEAEGLCTPTGDVTSFNPLEANSPFRDGLARRAGARLGGSAGEGVVAYGLSAGTERTEGTLRNDAGDLRHIRGALAVQGPVLRLALTAAHARRDTDLPFGGLHLGNRVGAGLLGAAVETENGGYAGDFLEESTYSARQEAKHTTAGGSLEWDVLPWLALGARGGRDQTEARDELRFPGSGFQEHVSDEQARWHWGADATLRGGRGGVRGAVTGGLERLGNELLYQSREEFNGGFQASETTLDAEQRALLARGSLGWRGLLLGGSVRRESPRAAGDSIHRLAYSLGGEWTLGGTAGLPGWVDGLTLRAAHGRVERGLEWASLTPGQFPSCGGACGAGAVETLTETEAGVDLRLLGRVDLGVTGYRRASDDVFGTVPFVAEAGSVTNRGVEAQASLSGPDGVRVRWRVDLTAAANRNRFASDRYGFFAGLSTAHRNGRPLGSYYLRPITGFADADGDGLLDGCFFASGPCEVQLGDTVAYAGTPLPDRLGSLAGTLGLGTRVTLSARADWQGGARVLDYTSALRCEAVGVQNCPVNYDPGAPLEAQAAVAAAFRGSNVGFVHDADFVRLREVALTVQAPGAWTRRLGAAGLELTFAGRNLALWTDYPGLDPETSTAGPSLFGVANAFDLPPARTFTTRIDVRF